MLHILSWNMQSMGNLRNPVAHDHIAGVDVILEMIQEKIFLLQFQLDPVTLRFSMFLELRVAPWVIHWRDIYLSGLWLFIICVKRSGFFDMYREFLQLEHAGIIYTGIKLVVKGMNDGDLCMIGIVLLYTVFINQLVHLLVEADALADKYSGTEGGANQVYRGFIDYFFTDLLFKHAFGMIYLHRELVVKELVNVRAEELISGVDVRNAFPSENDGEATL